MKGRCELNGGVMSGGEWQRFGPGVPKQYCMIGEGR